MIPHGIIRMNFLNIFILKFLIEIYISCAASTQTHTYQWTPTSTQPKTNSYHNYMSKNEIQPHPILFDNYLQPQLKPEPHHYYSHSDQYQYRWFSQVQNQELLKSNSHQGQEGKQTYGIKINADDISITTTTENPKADGEKTKPDGNPEEEQEEQENEETEPDSESDSNLKKPKKEKEKETEEEMKESEKLSPFQEIIKDVSKPSFYIPILNDFTFIALIFLFMPAIVPGILVPLSFYAVGAILIPIVRVNYYVNRYLDPLGEGI